MAFQLINWMSIPWNQDLLALHSQAACPHVCYRSQLFTSVLTFSPSSNNSHSSLSRLCVVGSGLVCICCQCFCHLVHGIIPPYLITQCQGCLVLVTFDVFACPLYLCFPDSSQNCMYDIELFVQWITCPWLHAFLEHCFPITNNENGTMWLLIVHCQHIDCYDYPIYS